ncbi:MAG TPA: hypothetical protein VD966_01050 [Pyrinomonadaceae bacterium]|nr:hypothetical protein [Pyrinomonadaceae bacterium]
MKNLIRLLTFAALVAALALPAYAQNTQTQNPAGTTPAQSDQETEDGLYGKFYAAYQKAREILKSDPNLATQANAYQQAEKEAYEIAKEYLQKFSGTKPDRASFINKFVTGYEKNQKAQRYAQVDQLIKEQKFEEAFTLTKQILAENSSDLRALNSAAWAGLNLATRGTDTHNAEAANYARTTLQLLEAGKTFEEGKPIDPKAKAENMGWLHYALGIFTIKNNPNEAIDHLIKAAQQESFVKKDPQTYSLLALAYQAGQYDKLRQDFQTRFPTVDKAETPEGKAATENLNQVIDRIIDAYARAIALAGNDPKFKEKKADWMQQVTGFYKYRHEDSDAGLNELIAGVLSKPLPEKPTMVSAPPSAPTTGNTSSTGAATTTTPTTPSTNVTTPATPKTTTPATTTPGTTKPSTPATQPSSTATQTRPLASSRPTRSKASTNGTRRP